MQRSGLKRIDIGLLLALDALLRFENVSQAARELGITQPALSTRLSRLRELFGDRLFVPSTSGRGITPTPRAQALRPHLSDVLLGLQAIVSPPAAFEPASSDRRFVIGLYRNPSAMLAPALAPRVIDTAPDVQLSFVWPTAQAAVEQLASGAIDIVLGSDLPVGGDFVVRTLLEEPLQTAQRAGHPRGSGTLDLDAFCTLRHVIIAAEDDAFNDHVDEELAKLGRTRRISACIQSYAVVPKVVERSDCICTLPRSFLAMYGGSLEVFAPPLKLGSFRLCAYWHPRVQHDEGHAWLRRLVTEAVQHDIAGSDTTYPPA